MAQQGFKVVIAPSEGEIPGFADIFRNNCAKNGVLTIQLSSAEVDQIFAMAISEAPLEAMVNLEEQMLTVGETGFSFKMDAAVKEKLLLGMDDISETLQHEADITAFEETGNTQLVST